MLARLSALLALLGALAAGATPLVRDSSPVTIPLTKRLNFTSGTTLVESDKARIQSMVAASQGADDEPGVTRAVVTVPVTNRVVSYVASVSRSVCISQRWCADRACDRSVWALRRQNVRLLPSYVGQSPISLVT